MQESWMDEFTASFTSPTPDAALVNRVRRQMRELVVQRQKIRATWSQVLYILLFTGVSIPLFLLLNYGYYLVLQSMFSWLLPEIVHYFVVIFIISASLMGSLCYGSVPIWAAYWLKHARGR